MTRALAVLCALLALAAVPACDGHTRPDARELDDATMAVLNTARALHHEADVYEAAGDYPAATHAIERVLAMRIPPAVEEAEDIRVDAWGRLAELALASGDPDRALANSSTGLRDSRRESVLTARLYVAKGRALRALAERAQSSGDASTAASRRRDAIDALETSIRINQRVLGRALDGGSP